MPKNAVFVGDYQHRKRFKTPDAASRIPIEQLLHRNADKLNDAGDHSNDGSNNDDGDECIDCSVHNQLLFDGAIFKNEP